MSLTKEQIRDSERAHYLVQVGTYFTQLTDKYGEGYAFKLAYTEYVNDIYYNQAYGIVCNEDVMLANIVKIIEDYFSNLNRIPCIYTTPATHPSSINKQLVKLGYIKADEESWMYLKEPTLNRIPSNLEIKTISSEDDLESFSKVFYETMGGAEGFDVDRFIKEIMISHRNPPGARIVLHLLASVNDEPVGIASGFLIGKYCGIYNVGTLTRFRGQGIGSNLCFKLTQMSKELGARMWFLQTIKGGDAEIAFKRMGYITEYIREGYVPTEHAEEH